MALSRLEATRRGTQALGAAVDLRTDAETAFAMLCEVEKWPVWLSFLRSAQLVEAFVPFGPGSEVRLRSAIPGEPEQLFEVDHFITNYQISLVGAYSTRRRLDFRLERKTSRCKLNVRIEYPAYGGRLALMLDSMRCARKLAAQLEDSVTHFKNLAEYNHNAKDELLADF
jgi:uncharacterized membrane protein